ncbi:MAG: hypothetical protein IPG04_16215 [Polyangiaceae bacterium]|nr:hypothetical protein [Polyangiaceae bacterium]
MILSTHLLPDVERLCDHVVVMQQGRIVFSGTIAELRGTESLRYEVREKGGAGSPPGWRSEAARSSVSPTASSSRCPRAQAPSCCSRRRSPPRSRCATWRPAASRWKTPSWRR